VERSASLGAILLQELQSELSGTRLQVRVRGVGLMAGVELREAAGAPATETALKVIQGMLRRGFILLPEGGQGNVISFTPPLTISGPQLRGAIRALAGELRRLA
jgi:4-aminobutyrate aminotransferase-like enzyme